jgi:integrase/recombinase XerD
MKCLDENFIELDEKLNRYLLLFIEHLRIKNKSPHTIKNYFWDIKEFLVWYQDSYGIRLDKVNKRVISEYIGIISGISKTNNENKNTPNLWTKLWMALKNEKIKSNSRNCIKKLATNSKKRKISAISQFYSYLIADELLGKKFQLNPVNRTLHSIQLKDVDIQHTVRLTKDDFELLIEKNWRPREQLILHLLFFGGLRLAELTGLKVGDLDSETQTITLRRKGGLIHKLKINNFYKIHYLWEKYLHYIRCESKDHFIFSNKISITSKPISERAMSNIIHRCFKNAHLTNKGLTPHSFRKGCATELYQNTKDLLLVRDYLNHQDAKVTQTYIDLIQ